MMPVHAPSLVGCSAALRAAIDLARRFAPLFHPVLLVGPTGVGKSTLARLLHDWSGRVGDFVGVTGGELVDTLFHNQLFGHEKGSYTGATDQAPGAFERAAGGTLLLDELQHWSRDKQAAILAPLQDARVTRVGGRRALPITCRVVLASTIPLERLVHDDKLLPDLQYRIGDLVIELPPLLERRVDVAVLAYHFLDREREAIGTTTPALIEPNALEKMLAYKWPGNVRELERVVQYAAVRAAGQERLRLDDLPPRVTATRGGFSWRQLSPDDRDALIAWALHRVEGSRGKAATLLGVHANTIDNYRKHAAAQMSSQETADSALKRPRQIVTGANARRTNHKAHHTIPTPARVTGVIPCDIQPNSAPTPMSEAV
jgi:DNA-binding NtrC family response regulator